MKIIFAIIVMITAAYLSAAPVKITDFLIDETEVTVGEYREFAQKTGYLTHAEKIGGGYEWGAGWQQRKGWTYLTPYGEPADPDEPAAHIDFYDALSYCQYQGGNLPTSEQWTLAGYTELRDNPPQGFIKKRTYPYTTGTIPQGLNASWDQDPYPRQAPVRAMLPGVNGLYQMGGNLWEWGLDKKNDQRITLGGSWWYGVGKSTPSGFQYKPPDFPAVYIGFRCVYTE